jgi:dTDP-glucose 4,6-dehydratase
VRDRPGHDRRYAVDSSRLRALGWEPRVEFESGMAATVRWYQENTGWWRPLQSGEFWEFYRRNYRPLSPTAP